MEIFLFLVYRSAGALSTKFKNKNSTLYVCLTIVKIALHMNGFVSCFPAVQMHTIVQIPAVVAFTT